MATTRMLINNQWVDYLSQRDLGDEQEPSEYGKCGYCSAMSGVPPDPDCPKHGVSQWLDRMQME